MPAQLRHFVSGKNSNQPRTPTPKTQTTVNGHRNLIHPTLRISLRSPPEHHRELKITYLECDSPSPVFRLICTQANRRIRSQGDPRIK
ncbi:Protein of unknown function [Pyronema omphalodes CBS 100304]|uniref:Uncharacterized protein n=1 Tax=Pyronema omphalodes (strain CBS 100304) TaxID=1076935 RepID=U4LMA5_PYROM|nr:Protein of unknown function [Pyronema omphalodes CBS 100304]